MEGPLQYDAAVDAEVAKTKVKGQSEVAGRATVCIFPSLDTGNNTYKVSPPYGCSVPGCSCLCLQGVDLMPKVLYTSHQH